jgi:hypothetical protein
MTTEFHEFPATSTPLDTWMSHCKHSRAAFRFLSKHLAELSDELSCIVLWSTAEDEKRYSWCHLQRIHDVFRLRVVHLEGEPEAAVMAPELLYADPSAVALDRVLNVLDDMSAVPAQARLDLVRFIKEGCEAQLMEVTIAEMTGADVSSFQPKNFMLHELRAYCNALGA